MTLRRKFGLAAFLLMSIASVPVLGYAVADDELDPVRNLALPCEDVGAAGLVSRAERRIEHLANRCEIVGTDVELQSRRDARGRVRDYAFVGTMGAGFQIF